MKTNDTLEGQIPFQGLPRHIVDIYRTSIQPGSAAEKILLERKTFIHPQCRRRSGLGRLGLQTIAQAASLRESVLAPMISGERLVGYFQVSNHQATPSNSQDRNCV